MWLSLEPPSTVGHVGLVPTEKKGLVGLVMFSLKEATEESLQLQEVKKQLKEEAAE